MTNIRRLLYCSHGCHCIKKRYRHKQQHLSENCFDASKLPADLDFSDIQITLGVNIHSNKFPIFGFKVRLSNKCGYHLFSVTNVENAPVPILNKIIEAVKRHEKIYYRALDELGDAGKLLKDLDL